MEVFSESREMVNTKLIAIRRVTSEDSRRNNGDWWSYHGTCVSG
jgi:hypothetical protein